MPEPLVKAAGLGFPGCCCQQSVCTGPCSSSCIQRELGFPGAQSEAERGTRSQTGASWSSEGSSGLHSMARLRALGLSLQVRALSQKVEMES